MAYFLPTEWGFNSRGPVKTIIKKRNNRERKRSSEILLKPINVQFPEDLLIEILSWVPVKYLLEFKLVSKSWYAIIKNPHFAFKHLKNYGSSKASKDEFDGCLITQRAITQAGELNNRQLLVTNNNNAHRVIAYENVETPMYNTYMCGPCHGIYYLWRFYTEGDRFLWNPVLNECKKLPSLLLVKPNHVPSHIALDRIDFYGFGYDPYMNDYKVIVIKGYHDTTPRDDFGCMVRATYPLSIFIYSLQNDCWSYWGELSKYYYLNNNKCYVFTNNSAYWLGSLKDRYSFCDVIVSFNLATNNAQELQPPKYHETLEQSDDEKLVLVHESVALLVGYYRKKCYKLWVLDGENWTNRYMIDLSFTDYFWRPVGHWKDGKLIFLGEGLYDLDTQETAYFRNHYHGICENVCTYNESLVSIMG